MAKKSSVTKHSPKSQDIKKNIDSENTEDLIVHCIYYNISLLIIVIGIFLFFLKFLSETFHFSCVECL